MTHQLPPSWDPAIPDDIALATGRFLAAASMMDHALQEVIWHLIGNDHRELIRLTWSLGPTVRTEVIDDILPGRMDETRRADWTEAKKLVQSVGANRNWIAHGFWWSAGDPRLSGYIRAHKGKSNALKPVTARCLENWTDDARRAIGLVVKLLE